MHSIAWQKWQGTYHNCVRICKKLLHIDIISIKQSADNDNKSSFRPTSMIKRLLISSWWGNMLSTNWLGFQKCQLNNRQQQVKSILDTRAAWTSLDVDVCDKWRHWVWQRLQHIKCTKTTPSVLLKKGQHLQLKIKVQLWIYIVPDHDLPQRCSDMDHSFTGKQHHACFYLVSVHQMAPSLIVVADI